MCLCDQKVDIPLNSIIIFPQMEIFFFLLLLSVFGGEAGRKVNERGCFGGAWLSYRFL